MVRTSLKYRLGTRGDFEQLKALYNLAYGEFMAVLTPENQAVLKTALSSEEKLWHLLDTATCFVCEDNGYIAGMAYLVQQGNPTPIYPPHWAYVRMVGVDPAYRGHGIARHLTMQCIAHARETGEQTIGLHTSEMMDAARHIYERLGFEVEREIEPIFGKRYWLYRLDISTQ